VSLVKLVKLVNQDNVKCKKAYNVIRGMELGSRKGAVLWFNERSIPGF
jgi:hypothetical protein